MALESSHGHQVVCAGVAADNREAQSDRSPFWHHGDGGKRILSRVAERREVGGAGGEPKTAPSWSGSREAAVRAARGLPRELAGGLNPIHVGGACALCLFSRAWRH
jgi:hypothetical protein